jgi:uncharacterized membrane protein YqiK
MAFNMDTPTLEQIDLVVLAIVALVAVVAWLSHRRRARLNNKWITLVQNASSSKKEHEVYRKPLFMIMLILVKPIRTYIRSRTLQIASFVLSLHEYLQLSLPS